MKVKDSGDDRDMVQKGQGCKNQKPLLKTQCICMYPGRSWVRISDKHRVISKDANNGAHASIRYERHE